MADLSYRPFRDADVPGILALWEAAGWGTLDEPTWRQWFLETPNGSSIVIVALDGDRVLGQMVFTPAVLDTEAGPFRAVRLAAPVLHPSTRLTSARSLQHPAVRLFFTGMDEAREAGYDAIYAQPERAWLAFFRWGKTAEHFTTSELGCSALPLPVPPRAEEVEEVDTFTDEHTSLWESARDSFGVACGVHRSPRRLQYRLGDHKAFQVKAAGELQGYVAVRPSDGLIVDAVAASPETLASSVRAVAGALSARSDLPFAALKAMRTPAWAGALDAAGFEADDYSFVLSVCPLSKAFPTSAADPEAWYAVPAD